LAQINHTDLCKKTVQFIKKPLSGQHCGHTQCKDHFSPLQFKYITQRI